MPHPIEPSTLRILRPTGETVGTGFLVSKHLAVTCAHVVKILGAGAGDTIDIRFTGKSTATTARVLPEYWRPDDSTDIAILQVDEVPTGVFPLRMGRASESRLKNDLYTFGYAIAADEQGIGGLGTFITLKQEGNFIQFRMHEANHGHSGAPIYDDNRGVVVGMVKKGHTGAGRNAETTFAIPAETIWQVCPQLKPPTPVLPRRNPIVEGIHLLPYDYDQRIQNFLTEYLGTDSHPVPFGGRDDALKMLDTWLAETTPYLLLAAPAGRGKSALLVRWLDNLKAREDLALAFVPASIRFGTNMERVFYAALAARLAYLHGDDISASPETSTAVYRGLVSDYLSKPLANRRTLLVVLDGLDEAADWQAGADFMPGELPAGVRVVVSARFLAGDADSTPWLRRLNWERNGLASAPSLTPLDRAGVADVLLKMGCPLDELSRQVNIVAELYRLSEGDPLLVGLYVGDLWAKGDEVTHLKPEDLVGIQPGYKGYFDRWWDDQKKLWGKDKPWLEQHVWTLLNLLAGAMGPLLKEEMQALAPELKSNFIADALDVLQRFIIGDNQNQGYTFSHPKLGQYFWEALTTIEQAQVESHFLAWGEQTLQEFVNGKRDPKQKADIPVYVLRNYSAHLARAGQPLEKWLPLIQHQGWAQAWYMVEGGYGGYSEDVQRVWKQCRLSDKQAIENTSRAPYLGQQIRCTLIEATLREVQTIPVELMEQLMTVGIWAPRQILSKIRQTSDIFWQVNALEYIVKFFPESYFKEVTELVSEIMQSISTNTNEYTRLLHVLWKKPLLSEKKGILDKTWDERMEIAGANKVPVWAINSESLPIDEIEQIINKELIAIGNIIEENKRLELIIPVIANLPICLFERIYTAVRTMSWSKKATALVLYELLKKSTGIYRSILEADLISSLLNIEDKLLRIKILKELAMFYPNGDEIVYLILDIISTMEDTESTSLVLSEIVETLPTSPKREVHEKVLDLSNKVTDKKLRALILCEVARKLPEHQRYELLLAALQIIQQVNDVFTRAHFLGTLADYISDNLIQVAITELQNFYPITERDEKLKALINRSIAKLIRTTKSNCGQSVKTINKVDFSSLPHGSPSLLLEKDYISQWNHTIPLNEIVPEIVSYPPIVIYQVWCNSAPILVGHRRSRFFIDLEMLFPALFLIGNDYLADEIYAAVRDVTTWWP